MEKINEKTTRENIGAHRTEVVGVDLALDAAGICRRRLVIQSSLVAICPSVVEHPTSERRLLSTQASTLDGRRWSVVDRR